MELSDGSELRSWLLSHDYPSESIVFSNILSMCDTLEDLKCLHWEDIESHMPTVKVGARRTLMAKIESLKPAVQTQTESSNNEDESMEANSSSSSPQGVTNAVSHSTVVVSTTQRAKVDELLQKCENRIIYGREDLTRYLPLYQAEINKVAVLLLASDPHLITFCGTDIIKHVKVGALLAAAKASLV